MILKKLKFCNFMSYGNYWTELDLQKPGLRLIIGNNKDEGGSNGSGKTNILEALCWTLFGKTIRDIAADKVTNYKTTQNTVGELEFSFNGNDYKIVRYRNHFEHKNKMELYKNGEDKTKSSVKLTEEWLYQDGFPVDWYSFTNSIVFSAENIVNFIGLNPEQKRSMLEKMLRLDIFTQYQTEAKATSKAMNERAKQLQSEIDQARMIVASDQRQLVSFQQKSEEFEQKRQAGIVNCDKIIQEFSELAIEEAIKVFEDIKVLQKKIEENNKKIQELMLELSNIQIPLSENKYKMGTASNNLARLKQKLADIEKACPTCGYPLPTDKVEASRTELNAEIAKLETEIDGADAIIAFNEGLKRGISERIADLNTENRNLSSRITSLTPEYDLDELMNIKAKIDEQRAVKDKLTNEKNPYDEAIDLTDTKVREAMTDIAGKDAMRINTAGEASYYTFWHDAFGHNGLKVYVLENIIPVLNTRINHYLSMLFSGSDYKVSFDKHLNESIIRNGIIGLNYNQNSRGERQRIDLAISFAIFDVLRMQYGMVTNVMFYDEVFDTGIDAIGSQKIYEILRANEVATKLVISHKETMIENADNIIEVTCEGGFSKITKS